MSTLLQINASLAGVVAEALNHSCIEEVFGGLNGVQGILGEDLVDLAAESQQAIRAGDPFRERPVRGRGAAPGRRVCRGSEAVGEDAEGRGGVQAGQIALTERARRADRRGRARAGVLRRQPGADRT